MSWLPGLLKSNQSQKQNSTQQTNAHLEHAPSDKVAEIVLDDGRFAEIYRVRLTDIMRARSASSDDAEFISMLLYICLKIDGEKPTLEQVLTMTGSDSLKLLQHLMKTM